MQTSLLKRCSTVLCCFLMCFYYTINLAQTNETLQEIDTIAFKKSLEEKSFDEVLDIFYANKIKDSLKASLTIRYIKEISLVSGDDLKKMEFYLVTASWLHINNDLDGAISNLDLVIKMADNIGNKKLLYEACIKKGVYLFEKGENDQALDEYLKALQIAKDVKNVKRQVIATNNINLIKLQTDNDVGIIDSYLKNLQLIKENNIPDLWLQKLEIYLGLAKAYINTDNYSEASIYCEDGLKLSIEKKVLHFQAYFITLLGEIEANKGNYKEAHALFDKVKVIIDKVNAGQVLDLFLKLYLGKTYFLENKYEKAIEEFLEIERLKEKYSVDYLSLQEMYIYLARSYIKIGDNDNGIEYYEKAKSIQVRNDKKKRKMNIRIVQEVDLANLKKEIEEMQSRTKRTKYLLFSGMILLGGFVIGLFVVNIKQKKKNKERFEKLMLALEEKKRLTQNQEEEIKKTSKTEIQKEKDVIIEIDAKTQEILDRLSEFEAKELYLSKDSTLVEVAKKIQTNTTYLSKVINTHKEKSFTAYITDLRVDYAIDRLSRDKKFRSFTIGAIAQEIGFKRSESFSKAFKVKTGLYPSYFVKELEKQVDSSRD